MTYSYDLPLLGGVVQAQRLVLPPQAINSVKSFRHACLLAWKLRTRQGNTAISQYQASQARLTVMEELQAMRAAA